MPKRILVIDDEESVRKSFELALEDTGYVVKTAASGERGIAMKERDPYDLIFLDLRMPGMNGVETLSALRRTDPHVPIYIVTAFYVEFLDQLKKARSEGVAFEVLQKPVGADQIVAVVKGVLEDAQTVD